MRRTTRCALAGGLIALLLGLLFLPLAKGSIDKALAASASAGLTKAGVAGVAVNSNWADLTLSGPAGAKDAALAAVQNMDNRGNVDAIKYVATDGNAPAPAASVEASVAAGTVALDVAIKSDADPKTITLSGTVADEAQRKTLVDAAVAAVGQANVVDHLTIGTGAVGPEVTAAVGRVGTLIGAFTTAGVTGSMNLKDSALTVNASAKSAQEAANANGALDAAKNAGVSVNGQVTAAAAPAPSAVQDDLKKLIALKGITFQTGSANLTTQGKATLDEAAAILTKASTVKVEVAGHTDNVGNASANLALSKARAQTVRNYLISKGIDGARLTANGYGQTKPVADNNTEAGRQANRRIDLNIVGS